MPANGKLLQQDLFENIGGLNISDSVFRVQDGEAAGGQNYSYTHTGGFQKRAGHLLINSSPDTALKTLGLSLYNTTTGTKTPVRVAGTKFQAMDLAVPTFTNLSDDTASASTNFFSSSSTQPVVFSQFNTATSDILWATGAGSTNLIGMYSTTKATYNGAVAPSGSISTSVGGTGGAWATTGTYYYAVALRKRSTQAISNVSFGVSAVITGTGQKATITLSSITGVDTTLYDKFVIYRSAVGGTSTFTTGDLVAYVDTSSATYADDGTYVSTSENIPRAGSTILDNSVLPSGTPTCMAVFKRRLVTALGSTVYLADLNKSESWPVANRITIPSGGPITGLGIISFTSVGSNTIDEILCVFKERELWIITGTSISDWALKFIDSTGCPNQSLIVEANGMLCWVDYRGVHMWEGTSKPIYCSRKIQPLFQADGDLDRPKMVYGYGTYFRKEDSVVWALSHKIYGEQKFQIKMDMRLSMPQVQNNLSGRVLDAVFIQDSTSFPVYAMTSYISSTTEEVMLLGDDAGYVYNGFTGASDVASTAIDFQYMTKAFDQGNPNLKKRYHKVVVWVEEVGDWNLALDWWTDYKLASGKKSTRALPINTQATGPLALWDIAQWDVAYWDDTGPKVKPLVFHLASDANNNSEGYSITLNFRQQGADEPVSIHGFSLLFSEAGSVT